MSLTATLKCGKRLVETPLKYGTLPTGTKSITQNGETDVSDFAKVNVDVSPEVELEDKTIVENGVYTHATGYDGFGTVTVNIEPALQTKSVTPTTSTQEVIADSEYDGLEKVNVGAIPSEYIIPAGTKQISSNGSVDVTEFASASVNVQPLLQDKSVTPTKQTQTVEADEGYYGLDEVTVNPIPDSYIIPEGSVSITQNGTVDVTDEASAVVNVQPTLQNKTATENGAVNADAGYDGLGTVTVAVPTGLAVYGDWQSDDIEVESDMTLVPNAGFYAFFYGLKGSNHFAVFQAEKTAEEFVYNEVMTAYMAGTTSTPACVTTLYRGATEVGSGSFSSSSSSNTYKVKAGTTYKRMVTNLV